MQGCLGICSSIDHMGVILRVLSVGAQGWAVGSSSPGHLMHLFAYWLPLKAKCINPTFLFQQRHPGTPCHHQVRSTCTCYLRGRGRAKLGRPFLVPFHFPFCPHKGKDRQKHASPLIPAVFRSPPCTPPHSFFGLQGGARGHSAASPSSSVEGNGTSSPSIDTNTHLNLLPVLVSALKN